MPIFQTCAVLLDDKKEVYRKGETVTGSLVLDVTEDVTVKGVRVYLYGETLVKWDELSPGSLGGTKDYIAKEKYFGLVFTVFGKTLDATGPNHTLTAGRHNYSYKLKLPNKDLPSSFEGEFSAIRFCVKVEVDRPTSNLNQCWYRGITILDNINVNDSQYKASVRRQAKKQVSKALGLGYAGSLTLTAATDRRAYCAGEKVALKVVVQNESTQNMGILKAKLKQKVVYTAGERKTRKNVIRILEGTPVMKGEERVWNNQLLEVDVIPPSTKSSSCKIIAVSYYIKIVVKWIDASSDITYTKCNRGFHVCRKSDGNFVNFNYIPMCANVVNYTFPLPPSPAGGAGGARPAAAAASRSSPAAAVASRPSPAAAVVVGPRPAAVATKAQPKTISPATFVQAPSPVQTPLQAHPQGTPQVPPQAKLQVSTSAMDLPPSYEDVLVMDNLAATTETAFTVVMEYKPYGVLFLRFPDTSVQEFRDTIGRDHQSRAECEGEIIAFAPQVIKIV
ncbi:arrestin domain-containing protein 3-like [Haliotis rubra]|uniref:arrestin domain-containing protein 3-like n=1 Tax=Haliotis rubra TaxID=36100 RepID=UPI001EE5870F|nr:arrestin domain-containing protein 3-like [Haliotis rubra]